MEKLLERIAPPLALAALAAAAYHAFFCLPDTSFLEKEVLSYPQAKLETPWLYVAINALVLFFPFALSFDKKVAYYKNWASLFPAIAIVGAGFIIWDAHFTARAVWGFNEPYLSGIEALGLPLGEWLFFITVPYACLFIYDCIKAYFPKATLARYADGIYWGLLLLLVVWLAAQWGKAYPGTTASLCIAALVFALRLTSAEIRGRFLIAYAISWIPFLIVNGILTGILTQEPIVIYNPEAFSGIRIGSIPIDDSIYSFLLLLWNMQLYAYFQKRRDAVPPLDNQI